MDIQINDKTYNVKYGFRSLMIFENIAKKSFEAGNITEIIIFLYSCVLASDKECNLNFDDFLDYVDENPDVITDFSAYLTETFSRMNKVHPEDKKDEQKSDPNV